MAKGGKKFTIGQIVTALRKHDGQPARAAEMLGTDRQTIHARIERSSILQATLREIEKSQKEDVRGAIAEAIRNKDMPTVRWFAERKMRDEGYGTHVTQAVDTAQIERIVEAIASTGGPVALRAVLAAITSPTF